MSDHNGSARPADGKSHGGAATSGSYTINLEIFAKRLKVFYSHWKENKSTFWSNVNAIAIGTPPPSDDLRYLKSSALNIWLLGYEFPETIMFFMEKQIHFLCSPKKANLLETLRKSAREAVGIEIVMHVKTKSDDGSVKMDEIIRAAHSLSKSAGSSVIGYISKEVPEGKLLETWLDKLKGSGSTLNDVANGFSELLACKDDIEQTCVRKAANLTLTVMKMFVVPKLEKTIDEETKVSHSTLMDETEKVILNPIKVDVKLKPENVDICYPPIFQSGGVFDLRPSASSNDDKLYYDSTGVIICAVGSRYKSYCSNIARTFLIDANAKQRKAYVVLLKGQESVINSLKPGNKVCAAYEAMVAVVRKEDPELVQYLTKSAGTGIGLEFRESGFSINSRNDRIVKIGMVFNVTLGFQNLMAETKNPKTQKFSLLLSDTVIITAEKTEVLTLKCSKSVADVAYSFNDEEEELPKVKPTTSGIETFATKATLRSDNQEMSKEEVRRQHQAELARQKNEETARRLAGGGPAPGDGRGGGKTSTDLVAYKNVNDVPFTKETMIYVDQRNESVLIPIHGFMFPLHISTVKSVTSRQDNRTCTTRVIFNVPGTPFNPHDANTQKNQNEIFLKEISFSSKDSRHSSEVVQALKTLRRLVASRESERAERATLVSQERLQLATGKMRPVRLSDLWTRPNFGGRGRKLPGSLQAHINGLRYSTSRSGEQIDIMYGNIKHAFFQPAEREMITLLHFHLHNHIMVGTKKTKDVQFYAEVMDVVQTLGGGRRSAMDPDEVEEEQRERERKNKINMDFQNFVNKVHDQWSQPQFSVLDLEFDQPLRELGFHGVPHKSSAFIVPTSGCLVELIENPFLVVTLNEIEIVNLERVGMGQKNFDMAIVFKDFKRDILRIDSIPSTSLDGIKEWLDTTDLKYYESRLNLNWRSILKTITEDPEKFIEDGGWEFLNMEASDSDTDNSVESDQGYEPSDVQSESLSEEDDSDSESLVESDESEEEEAEDSEEDKGKTWEELEREATNADREKGDESDSEDERKRRKMKAFGKARMPEKRGDIRRPPKRSKF